MCNQFFYLFPYSSQRRSSRQQHLQATAVALPLGRGQRPGFRAHGGRPLLLGRTALSALEHDQIQQLR